ncbi:MAG: type III-B CRISPR module RAMP protein Cmr6 [Aquificaceae bacterium]|nr:type III-B CRISPR module RAMP protein Cmr6 [Aquificaceae bacterium]MDW8424002.1 type III-B CRISPR module RAMP protein Cmr6 [Aquificaceae bacterium]
MKNRSVREHVERFMQKDIENLNLLLYKAFAFYFEPDEIDRGRLDQRNVSEKFKELLNRVKMQGFQPPSYPDAHCFEMKTAYRLVCGMGYPTLLENGLLLHHIYGVPYLSGETLKGLTRGVFLLSLYEALKDKMQDEKNPLNTLEVVLAQEKESKLLEQVKSLKELRVILSDHTIKEPYESFLKLFGSLQKRGEVIFYDAYPVGFEPSRHIEFDIMNPHYPEYYRSQGKEPPADWDSPVPVKFLTIAQGVVFRFCLGFAPLGGVADRRLLGDAEHLLKVGLENFGVGGKRRKGYGWFVL